MPAIPLISTFDIAATISAMSKKVKVPRTNLNNIFLYLVFLLIFSEVDIFLLLNCSKSIFSKYFLSFFRGYKIQIHFSFFFFFSKSQYSNWDNLYIVKFFINLYYFYFIYISYIIFPYDTGICLFHSNMYHNFIYSSIFRHNVFFNFFQDSFLL